MLGWHYLQHLVWWSCQFYFLLFLIIYLFFSNSYRIAEQISVLILSVLSCSWFCCLFFTKQFIVPVNHDCFSIGNVIILLINFFPFFSTLYSFLCSPDSISISFSCGALFSVSVSEMKMRIWWTVRIHVKEREDTHTSLSLIQIQT